MFLVIGGSTESLLCAAPFPLHTVVHCGGGSSKSMVEAVCNWRKQPVIGGSSQSTGWAEVRQQLPGMEAAHITTFGNTL